MDRPPKSRKSIARTFVAKSVYNRDTTRTLLDRLEIDKTLRNILPPVDLDRVFFYHGFKKKQEIK